MKYIFLFIFLFYLFIYYFFIIIFGYAIAYLRTGSYAPVHPQLMATRRPMHWPTVNQYIGRTLVDYRLTIGRLLFEYRSTIVQLSVDYQLIVDISVNCPPIYRRRPPIVHMVPFRYWWAITYSLVVAQPIRVQH